MSAIDAPLCRLCQKIHWPRAGCDFGKSAPKPIRLPAPAKALKPKKKAKKKGKRK